MFCKNSVFRNFTNFTGKHLCQSLFLNKVPGLYNFIKKKTLAQMFSCEFCEISKNIFLHKTLWWLFLIYNIEEVLLHEMEKKNSFIIDLLGLRSFYKSFKSFKLVNIGATHLTSLSHATKMIEISQQTFVFRKKT